MNSIGVMTKTEQIAELFEEVLRATYVTTDPFTLNFTLKIKKMYVDDLATEEGRELHRESYISERQRLESQGSTDAPYYQDVSDSLRDLDDPEHANRKREELKQETAEYVAQRRAWTSFILQHRDALDYLATLASNSRKKTETPSEEIVFETLRQLSGKMIMGQLGAGAETLEATLYLHYTVQAAAYKHAQRIGQNPEAYYSSVTAGQQETFVRL